MTPKPAAHTPVPWKIAHYEGGLLEGLNFIEGSDKMEVCSINDASASGKANAAFIVRACNAHEELVSFLNLHYGFFPLDVARKAKELIAKAQGK